MKISVIIATYNSAKTLRRCIDSIVPQLGDDGELIIIDGNSKDETMDIVKSYGNMIAYSVSEPDKGVYDAWNKGIEAARGNWITFIGSDDAMLPCAFEEYKRFFETNGEDFDLICGKLHYVDSETGALIREVGEPWNWNKLIHRKWKLAHPGMLNNKRCFERIGNFDVQFKICADSDFLQRLGPSIKTGYIDEYLVNMSSGGISDSGEAIRESYLTRKKNRVISPFSNYYGYMKLLLRYRLSLLLRKVSN